MSPELRPTQGPRLLRKLTANDSWIQKAYVLVAKAGREISSDTLRDHVVAQANRVQAEILSALPASDAKVRPIDGEKAAVLEEYIAENNGGLIVMRHGIQYVEDDTRKVLIDPVRKIRLMQMPFNHQDPADAQSLAEAAGLALVLNFISREHNIPIDIRTSQNTRAADIAAILSVVNGFQVAEDSRLTCVNYPSDRTDEELERLLGENSGGALVFKREILDAVCGEGTYDRLTDDVNSLVTQYRNGGKLVIALTHTPQTNAADVMAGDAPVRMPELGFRIFTRNRSTQFLQNIFGGSSISV